MYPVRLMLPSDLPQVLALEGRKPAPRWTYRDFLPVFDSADTDGRVAAHDDTLAGFLVFKVPPERPAHACFSLLNVAATVPGIGLGMLEELNRRLPHPEGRIQTVLPESNLPAQLLLREEGFRAVRLLRGHYGAEDGYLMEWRRAWSVRAG